MGKGPAKTKLPSSGSSTRGGKPDPGKEIRLSGALRAMLHRLEDKLGLFPADSGSEGHGRFHAPVLLPSNKDVPEAMRALFEPEFAALERLGKAVVQCHARSLKPLILYCLPYYYYDGFTALLYAEQDGQVLAAWKEQEVEGEGSPATVRSSVQPREFQASIQQALDNA
jgi:hypothetical protein